MRTFLVGALAGLAGTWAAMWFGLDAYIPGRLR